MTTTFHSHSSRWGAFTAEVRNGRLVGVQPFEHDGQPSPMIDAMPAAVHDEARVAAPMVRQGYLRDGPSAGGEGRGRDGASPRLASTLPSPRSNMTWKSTLVGWAWISANSGVTGWDGVWWTFKV